MPVWRNDLVEALGALEWAKINTAPIPEEPDVFLR